MPIPVIRQTTPVMQLSTTFRGISLVHADFFPSTAEVGKFLLAQGDCFSMCPHHGLDHFAHILTPTTHRP